MFIIGGGPVVHAGGLLGAGWLAVEDGVIVATGEGDPDQPCSFDLAGRTLAPGFVDQHCHGGGGNSFITTDVDEARRAVTFHRQHGTTSLIASLVSGSAADLTAQIRTLIPLVDEGVIFGIHLEGPWIASARCGAHDIAQLRSPTESEVSELLAVGDGRIKMVTLAPELPGAIEAIALVLQAGAIAAIGHTDASHRQTELAIEAGASVATHLNNAMPKMEDNQGGPTGALLESADVTIEMIADGVHVPVPLLSSVFDRCGRSRVALITDAMPAAGAADGEYMLGNVPVIVVDGVARMASSGALAGSTLTLDRALHVVTSSCGVGLADAMTMLATTPARKMGLEDRGAIEVGKRADLIVLGSGLEVEAVMERGEWVVGAITAAE